MGKAQKPKTLRELDPPAPAGVIDAAHADALPEVYLDVEPGPSLPGEAARQRALFCRIPGRVFGRPDMSRLVPPSEPTIDERILLAAVASSSIDAEARQAAIERLNKLRQAQRPKRLRGEHAGQEVLSAWRVELVLSIYACSGRTRLPIVQLLEIADIPQWWMEAHKKLATNELRLESRRSEMIALYGNAGTRFSYITPLNPSEWPDRYAYIKGEERREQP